MLRYLVPEEEMGVSPGGGGQLAGQHQVGNVGLHTSQLLASGLFNSSLLAVKAAQ